MSFKVISTGPQAIFQDRGRFGFASAGVGTSGSFDQHSAARANNALGNDPNATVVEILLGGFEVEALASTSIVFTGTEAEVMVRTASGQSKNTTTNTIIDVAVGDRIRIEPAVFGMRAYFSARGGFAVEKTLGSASTDLISQMGPAPLKAGDVIELGQDIADSRWWPKLRQLPIFWTRMPAETLTVVRGPRDNWFTPESLNSFFTQVFTVSNDSNRIGLRMQSSAPIQRRVEGELKSEGMVRGSIQIPPGGHPVVFGPDHPVTGGYPVIAVLTSKSCDRSAQLSPGDKVRFKLV